VSEVSSWVSGGASNTSGTSGTSGTFVVIVYGYLKSDIVISG